MTSSILAGERRWASARRSGMTVLGKVAVPKPLNLPSQRLENHGLDPNVEIVPKGTLSWGSQASSVPNAWGSSALSPNADGSTSSPSQLSGRPSSASGTRPSTAGSDRTQDPTPNAWGQSSRPSSASGALTSNQTAQTSLRPRSAETRPGSAQLSRFAEPSSDSSVAWGPSGVSNKLGASSSKNDGFSLSSGDFPTLGSEKDNSGKSTDSQEHGYNSRPSSSGAASGKERNITSSVGNVNIETANTWTRDGSQQAEHGVQPTAEKWQGDMPPCANPNRLPQFFDAWHGPPINPPPGVWYRGPPGGPPYGTPLPPSGFPIEPFPFYRPQMPPNNTQPVPPGAGPRGHHPKNGEVCRPHVPDAYMHPRMPINPGFYPGPVAYEGYYGPPMGYCNPNEREMPFMGMAGGPPVYKRHPAENALDPHARAPAHGSRAKPLTPEQIDGGHSDDTRGPYKVLLKQSNDWDEKRAEEEWEHGVPSYVPHIEKRDQPRTSLQKNEWGLEARRDEEYSLRKTCSEDPRSRNFDNHGTCSSGSAKLPESRGNVNAVDNLGNKLENVSSSFPQPTQVLSATPKDPTLIQKIHGLNAKARISDGRPDAATLPCREDQYNKSQVDAMATYPAASSGTATLRRPSHGAQSRLDHRSKRFNNQDADGWRKKPFAVESSAEVSVTNSESGSDVLVRDCHKILEESGKSEYNPEGKDEDESLTLGFDASDSVAQRAKMREIAKQRAEQLQREEEERTREQKAKALAKLEELNRRTHITDVSSQKLEKAPPGGPVQQEEEVSRKCAESYTDSSKSETSNSALVRNQNDQIKGTNTIMVGENPVLFDGTLLEMPDNLHPKSDVTNCEAASQVSEGNVSKHKRLDSKQRQSINLGKNVTEKSVPVTQTEAAKYHTALAAANDALPSENIAIEVGSSCESSLLTNSNVMTESSTHHRKKNFRGSKNRHKVDDALPVTAVSSAVSKETNAIKVSTEKLESDTNLLQSKTVAKHAIQDSEQHSSLHSEETVGKGSNQWKSQQSRRMPRSLHASNRMGEKLHIGDAVTWAPVRSQNKIEVMDKPGDKTEPETAITNAKIESVVQNNMKTKRAEMERYIPKPVAKELAQQGSVQQPVISQNAESTQHGDSIIVDIGPNAESKNGDSKQNKPSKARGSWRQRGYVESAPNLGFQEEFPSSLEAGKGIQKPIEQGQSLKSDISTLQEQTKSSSDLNSTDDWNTNDNSDAAASVTSAVVKGQGVTDRGKRPSVKGHRSMGNNFDLDHGNANGGLTDDMYSEYPAPEMSQMDKSNALKENRFGGERTSQWQPKSQVYSVHNRRNRPSDEQIDAAAKSHKGSGENMPHTHVDQSSTEPMNVQAAPNMVHHEFKRERKAASFRGRPRSPNLSTVATGEPESVHTKHDQHFSSGFRKNGNHANRSGRGHESRGDVSSGGQDNRQHNASFNRERPRQNSHFEYQPIGQYSNNKSNNLEVSTEGSHNTGSKYRERNQDHSRRGGGNIYGRRSGTVQGDARYD